MVSFFEALGAAGLAVCDVETCAPAGAPVLAVIVLDLLNNDPKPEKRLFLGGSTADDDARCGFLSVFDLESALSVALALPFVAPSREEGLLAFALE